MKESARNNTEILILGGGFAGVSAAKNLLRKIISGFHVTLVDKVSYQDFHPAIYEIASSWMEPLPRKEHSYHEVVGSVSLPYKKIFGETNKLTLVEDETTAVDLKNKTVRLASGKSLNFDFLVLALGSETNFFGIPHLEERAFVLKNVNDAMNLRDEIEERFFDKNPELKILIGGGGFTGVELAAELTNFVHKLCGSKNIKESSVSISILEATDSILGAAPAFSKKEAYRRLKELGVEVNLNSPIKDVEKSFVQLASGEKVDYDLLVWTAGVKASPLLSEISGLELTKVGSVLVNEHLQAQKFDNVYAIGDGATFLDKNGKSLPPTAQKAIYEGRLAATNIANTLLDFPLLSYKASAPSFFIPLGGKSAVGKIGFLEISGVLGWWFRELIDFHYFATILPFFDALSLWLQGVSVFDRND